MLLKLSGRPYTVSRYVIASIIPGTSCATTFGSRKKSIGSMVWPASTQPPSRSCAKMKTSGPLPRGTEAVILSA